MKNTTRGAFLIAGSLIAFFGFLLPGVYGVGYDPPPDTPAALINLGQLPGFHGFVTSAQQAVYNGFQGPTDFAPVLLGLGLMLVLGISARRWNVPITSRTVRLTHHGIGVLSAAIAVGTFIWAFRLNKTPPSIIHRFVEDLGNNPASVRASHYLQGQLGLGAVVVFFGLLVGLFGALWPFDSASAT